MEKVKRIAAPVKKISCKEEFELCYLRHQYLRKAEYNPTDAEMAPYYNIAKQQARHTYYTYRSLMNTMGFGVEDLTNIAKVHLVSYLGLFSVEQMADRYDKFICQHYVKYGKDPEADAVLSKNKADFTSFLKQRMEDLIRVCRQKMRNVSGVTGDDNYVYVGEKAPPVVLADLVENYKKYGYKKLDIAVFKTIRKRAKAVGMSVFNFNSKWYVSVKLGQKKLQMDDFVGADMDPYDTIHYMSPDRILSEREDIVYWTEKREEFNGYEPVRRANMLRNFIEGHKNDPEFREEVKLARKMIKEIGA